MHDPAELADPRIGTPLAPVGLVGVDDPVGVVRAKPTAVLLSGSGDGVVAAAAAGLLDGTEAIRYSASLEGAALDDAGATAAAVLLTDSNRDRAHHWRGSQDVHGHTEPGGPAPDVLVPTNADRRLEVFPDDEAARQTVALQAGPVTAIASGYGEPYAYRPEDRAVMAIDGDPSTAWLVGDHGDPVGERIELRIDDVTDALTLRQPEPLPGGRTIDRIVVRLDDGTRREIELTTESFAPSGQLVPLPASATPGAVVIEIAQVTDGDAAVAASRGGVGFSEIDAGLGPTTEYIRLPVDAVEAAAGRPLAVVLTRLRVDPLDPWRGDPEPELIREFALPDRRSMTLAPTLRLDRRAPDTVLAAVLQPSLGPALTTASARLTGAPRHAGMFATDGDVTTSWITPFDGAVGATLTIPLDGPVEGALDIVQPPGTYSTITEVEIGDGTSATVLAVPPPDADGRSTLAVPAPVGGDRLLLTITGIDPTTTVDRRYGDVTTLPAAIAEVTAGGIEPVPLDDEALLGAECRTDLLTLDGQPVPVSFTTTIGALLDGTAIAGAACGGSIDLDGGAHRLRSDARPAGFTVDRVVLGDAELPVGAGTIPVAIDRDGARHRVVTVAPCPDGCWLVLGEGYNDAWSAAAGGTSLGPPQLLDGGFNGWWLPPSTSPATVELRWTVQRPVAVGLAISLLGVGLCLLVVVTTPRRRRGAAGDEVRAVPRPSWQDGGPPAPAWFAPVALAGLGTVLISPWWGLVGAAVGVLALLLEPLLAKHLHQRHVLHVDLVGWFGVALAVTVALLVVWINRTDRPAPNSGWTESFTGLDGPAIFGVLCVTVGAFAPAARRRAPRSEP